MRPIDADELLKDPDFLDESIPERVIFAEAVKYAPTIDAVEVCRCKYCKHRTLAGKAPFMFFLCSHNNGLRENVKDNDFCSYGERKDGEHDKG